MTRAAPDLTDPAICCRWCRRLRSFVERATAIVPSVAPQFKTASFRPRRCSSQEHEEVSARLSNIQSARN